MLLTMLSDNLIRRKEGLTMKQDCSSRKRAVSGFTLLEIVIVIAIISILLGVLVPTMRTYMTKSRLNTANSNAKVIFNSLQTIMQEYEFSERMEDESLFYGADSDPSKHKKGNLQLYCVNGVIDLSRSVVHNASGASPVDSSSQPIVLTASMIGSTAGTAAPRTIGARMNRLYSDYSSMTWCALIQDYSVAGVLCATSESSQYIGAYPLQIHERRLQVEGSTLTAGSIPSAVNSSITGSALAEYCALAWNKSMVYGSI